MAVADGLVTFESWPPEDNFDNAEWIWQQWVARYLTKYATKVWETRKRGRRGNKRLAMNSAKRADKKARAILPE